MAPMRSATGGQVAQAPLQTLLHRLIVGKPRVRRAAARILSKNPHDTPELREALRSALSDPDAVVRKFAARALGRITDDAAVGSLIPLLGDPFVIVRAA